jgi:hypothetical protein
LIAVRGSGDTLNTIGVIGVKISGALARRANDLGVDYGVVGLPYTAVGVDWWKLSPYGVGILFVQYQRSKNEGRDRLRAFIKQQVRDCPKQKLALVGFSQGAHVVGDVLSKNVGGLTQTEFSSIRAVALIADPRFNSREPFATGDNLQRGRNGLLGARSPGDLNGVSGRIRSWCRSKDLVCQRLPNPTSGIHNQNGYFADYGTAIVNFIAEKLGWGQPVVESFRVCPGNDTYPTVLDDKTARQGYACRRDYGAEFEPTDYLVCSAEIVQGSGRSIRMRLLRRDQTILTTPEGYVIRSDRRAYFWLSYKWSPSIPASAYMCQVMLNAHVHRALTRLASMSHRFLEVGQSFSTPLRARSSAGSTAATSAIGRRSGWAYSPVRARPFSQVA